MDLESRKQLAQEAFFFKLPLPRIPYIRVDGWIIGDYAYLFFSFK
jgi:hypothetical protein